MLDGAAELFEVARARHGEGDLAGAEAVCRQILSAEADNAAALHLLGVIALGRGDLAGADDLISRAVAIVPEKARYHEDLGAVRAFQGRGTEAVSLWERALELDPSATAAMSNLAMVMAEAGQLQEAIALWEKALHLKGDDPKVLMNLGVAFNRIGKNAPAVELIRRAIAMDCAYGNAHKNLGRILREMGDLDGAADALEKAAGLLPGDGDVLDSLAGVQLSQGLVLQAVSTWRRAVGLCPHDAVTHSNYLFALNFHPDCSAGAIRAELDAWNRQHATPLQGEVRVDANGRSTERRLRIGYLSPDFRSHCQAQFMTPLLREHDRERFEVTCFSDVARPDETTAALRGLVEKWRDVAGLSHDALADVIRGAKIDILVDLTMHMAHNRLLALARKPAPVQVCWLAYPGSTGLETMDYRISDPLLDPPGIEESVYSEKTIRVETFWCYDPLTAEPRVNPAPAVTNRFVTFGSLNNFCKVNEGVLKLWSEVLRAVPTSRMLILSPSGSHRGRVLEFLEREAVRKERIEFIEPRPRLEYLKVYHRIDIGLDTFPANGHTTSLDSFWMGVPVVTIAGETAAARAGLAQLTHLGLEELIARTPEQFVSAATALAEDLTRLERIRAELRGRMERSPLMDAPRFARKMEAAFEEMWRR